MIYYSLDYKPESFRPAEGYLEYAEVYKDVVRILLREYMNRRLLHDYCLAPVLYLFRRYIELQLKGIIMYHEVIVEHDIIRLYEMARKKIEERYGECPQPRDEVTKFVVSLGKFDNTSQAFRYPETKEGKDFFTGIDPWLYEKIMSISELNDIVQKVIGDLEGLEGYLDYMKHNKEEYFVYAYDNYEPISEH